MEPKPTDDSMNRKEMQEESVLYNNFENRVFVEGSFLPKAYLKIKNDIENFEVRDDDIWVCSYPRSGTTWTQEMVWCIGNDLNFEGAKEILPERFPYLEHSGVVDTAALLSRGMELPEFILDSVNYVHQKAFSKPRFIKTHLPFQLLPRQIRTGEKKPKIIYVSRNPKDTCVSFFHFCKLKAMFSTNFDTICQFFLDDKLPYAPYWGHVLGFWNRRFDLENCMFLKYEDIKADLPKVIQQIAKFLDKAELSKQQISLLRDHLSITKMKTNPAVNGQGFVIISEKYAKAPDENEAFIRAGQIGGWKEEMSPEMIARFDEWTRKNLEGSDWQP